MIPASAPMREIRPQDIADYERDGVTCLRSMFDPAWIDFLRDATDRAMADPGAAAEEYTPARASGRFFGDLDLWKRRAEFRSYAWRSPCAPIAGAMMRSQKINLFYDQLLVKEPQTRERTPWHQDQPYWAVTGRQVCSIWLPMDAVPTDVSIAFVKGSHLWPAHCPHHFSDNTPYRGSGLPELPDIDANRQAYDIGAWDLELGDCLIFQAMIVHGAPGNSSSHRRRRAISTRWTGDDARFTRRSGEVAIPRNDPGLADGAPMDCADFPLVWRRDIGLLAAPDVP